jgi:hypothetical protein
MPDWATTEGGPAAARYRSVAPASTTCRLLVIVAALALGAIVGLAGPMSAAGAVTPHVHALFRLSDPRLDEVSGIAAGIASPGVVYVQNDSGDRPRFFALDARTGHVLAIYTVPGARNVDWEDLAVAPDAAGVPSVWIADIGDNEGVRGQVQIYRVPEPHVELTWSDRAQTTARPRVWRLRYPHGPVDAESLAVSPRGVAYVITKSPVGRSLAYEAPSSPGHSVRTLRAVGEIAFSPTGTPGPFGPIGQLTATGAAISPDGRLLAVRTYTDAYLWRLGPAGVAAALGTRPVREPLPRQPQGEGIGFSGGRLLIDSEHVGSAVYSVALPRGLGRLASPGSTGPGSPGPGSTGSGSTGPPGPTVSPVSPALSVGGSPPPSPPLFADSGVGDSGSSGLGPLAVAMVVTILLGVIGAVLSGGPRRRKGSRQAGSGP